MDFTALRKRGLLKLPERKGDSRVKVDRDGSIDFTGMASSASLAVNSQSDSLSGNSSASGAISPFGFLDNLSSASSSGASSLDSTLMQSSSSEISALKIKMDDLDFKISSFVERMEKIESKLLEFESKVG